MLRPPNMVADTTHRAPCQRVWGGQERGRSGAGAGADGTATRAAAATDAAAAAAEMPASSDTPPAAQKKMGRGSGWGSAGRGGGTRVGALLNGSAVGARGRDGRDLPRRWARRSYRALNALSVYSTTVIN